MTKLRALLNLLKKIKNPFDMRDYHIYGGLLIMGCGLWQVAPWISLLVSGFLLFCSGNFAKKLA